MGETGRAVTAPMPLLEVQDLKTYFFTRRGVVKAVDGVSFSLQCGQTLALVGESGCGKSITCLSILRLVPEPAGRIVGGQVLFEGEDLLTKRPGEMRKYRGSRISMVLQDPMTSLNPTLSIGEQVAEVVRLHQRLRRGSLRERVVESLHRLKIPAAEMRLRDYPHQLSGGMRQRVTSAIAMSCQPHLLIADEPTTSLDVTIQAQYLELLREVQQRSGVSIIFVTHDFGIVAATAEIVAVMYAGKIVEMATTVDIFDSPRHPYTEALMRCLPRSASVNHRLVDIGGQPPDLGSLPPGCSFAPRCPRVMERCHEAYPPPVEVSPGHRASCWLLGGAP